jgi:O-antigen/teichoic acid export membrane protein
MNNSKQRKLGVILSYVAIISTTLIQLMYTPFLIRSIGQSEFGLYSLVNSIIGYLTIMDLGFGNAIVVYTAKYRAQKRYDDEKKLHGMFFVIFIIIGIIAGLCGLILYFNTEKIFGSTMTAEELYKIKIMMLILSFNLVISFSFSIYSSIINAYEKFIYQKIMTILNTLLKPLFMIPLLLLGYKSITLVIVITVLNLFVLLSNYIFCKKRLGIKIKYQGFDNSLFKTILGYSIWIFIGTIVDKINWSVDQFILGAVSGTIAVSLYSIASQLNTLFVNLSTAVSGILLPKISKMIANNATSKELTFEFIRVGRIQYLLIFLMASGIILFGKEFFIAWVGKDYVTSYYIALILILPLCIPLIQNLGISIMQAKNMHRFRSVLYAAIAVSNIIFSIPLAKNFGGIGSAIGTGISILIGNGIIINIYYYRKVGIDVIKFWKEILRMTIPNIIPILIILILTKFIEIHGYTHVIVFGAIYTGMYFFVCYKISMNKYEKSVINSILYKFIRIKK